MEHPSIEILIRSFRGHKVILDADLARLYGTQTAELASQDRSQIVTGSQKHRDPRFRPWVFTEHGAIMAATVLNSRKAVAMSVYVVRAFVRMREQLATDSAILRRLAEIDRSLLQHDSALRDIYRKLLPLLQPPPDPPKRSIGFISGGE